MSLESLLCQVRDGNTVMLDRMDQIERQIAEIGQMVSAMAGNPGEMPDLPPEKPIGAVTLWYDRVVIVGHACVPASGLIPIREETGKHTWVTVQIPDFDGATHRIIHIEPGLKLTDSEAKTKAETELFHRSGMRAA